MQDQFLRTERLLGQEGMQRLRDSFVVVAGLGAVGSFAAEALVRSGLGKIRLIDFDEIKPTNINRQLYALHSTVGKKKTEVALGRVHDINPECQAEACELFIHHDTLESAFAGKPDVIIDAIDSLNPKVELISGACEQNIKLISSMGAALRRDPFHIKTGDIFKTGHCPLARRVRKFLRRRGISNYIPCVYSTELLPQTGDYIQENDSEERVIDRGRIRNTLGSLPTITGMFGLIIANWTIDQLCKSG